MIMEDKINEKISELKELISEITEGFFYTKREINILTIASLSMILIDDEIEDLILETLKNTLIIFTSKKIKELYHDLFPNQKDWKTLKHNSALYFGSFLSQGKLCQDHLIIVPEKNDLFWLFDNLIHELKHAINEIFLKFTKYQGTICFYSGLAKCNEKQIFNEAIDEAFNSYLTKIYLDNIKYLKSFNIKDLEIKELLDEFTLPKNYHYAYEKIVLLCLPLFQSKYIFKELYYGSLYKCFSNLDNEITKALGYTKNSAVYFHYLDRELKRRRNFFEELDFDYKYLQNRVRIKPYLK